MTAAVIFDVDGTLVDSNDLHAACWSETFRSFGYDIGADAVRPHIGKGGDQLIPALLRPEDAERDAEGLQHHRASLFERCYQDRVKPFSKVRALMERLRASGIRIILGSSGKAEEVDRSRNLLDIRDLVEDATTADDAERSKPHPDIFAAALARLAPIEPEQALVVGDTPYDAQAARAAGLSMIGLTSGGFDEEDLRAAGCMCVYRDIEDLLENYETSPIARLTARPKTLMHGAQPPGSA
jgi:HAD superfamily hydrolase (TIGR01509 family)